MNKNNRFLSATILLLIFVLGTFTSSYGQRRNAGYPELAARDQQNPVSFDFILLPGDSADNVQFTSIFSLSYSFLPFKKFNGSSQRKGFYSNINLSMEVFHSNERLLKKNREDQISVEGLEPAGRSYWADTAYADTYEQSQSKQDYLNGSLQVSLEPGIYSYLLQMKRGEETDSRMSRTRTIRVEAYGQMKTGNLLLGTELKKDSNHPQLKLTQMADGVQYGKDFYALAYMPRYDSNASYTLQITTLNVADEDTTKRREIYSKTLASENIRTGILPTLDSHDNANYITLNSKNNGYTYALIKIPNSNFPNALYRFTIRKEGEQRPVTTGTYRSIWTDMPTSLLSLDVATEMLHYIVNKETLNRISSGTKAEREQKFREFWKQRDPTPDTEYNELMAEYYRRIDYAYKNFTTENQLGYESDRGEVYIKFGPPSNIERKFPTDGPTTEIWTYPNRQFVFEATTGFGDFRLVSRQSK